MRDKNNDLVVVKANELIQKYKYTLSKTELRVVNTIISKIKSPLYDEELNIMEFDINEFCKLLGWEDVGGNNYKMLRAVLRNLSNKSSDYIDFGGYETIVRWIDKPIFEEGSGIVKLKLDDDLKPFLLQASGAINAKLKYYFDMDSKYSMRLYELLKSWDGFKKYTYELDELKLCIDATKDSYKSYGKFRQAVLDPAVEEINKVTDLLISYETKTRGRKVTHIEFSIRKKNVSDDVIDGEAKEMKDTPDLELPDTEFKEQQTTLFNVAEEKYSKENALYAEAMNEAFTDEEVTELVKIAKGKVVENPFLELSYKEEMKIYHYIQHYYNSLKMIDIKSTPYHALRDKLLHDYDRVIE